LPVGVGVGDTDVPGSEVVNELELNVLESDDGPIDVGRPDNGVVSVVGIDTVVGVDIVAI